MVEKRTNGLSCTPYSADLRITYQILSIMWKGVASYFGAHGRNEYVSHDALKEELSS